MNPLDKAIAAVAPTWAANRARSRKVLAAYEAAKTTIDRRQLKESSSGDTAVARAGTSIRQQTRALYQNLDLFRGVVGVLVRNVVGPEGITFEPQPKLLDGTIDNSMAEDIDALLQAWGRSPEVTRRMTWAKCQRKAWMNSIIDGEVFTQVLEGTIAGLTPAGPVPLALELLEADFVPLDYNEKDQGILQGIRTNSWGQATGYVAYKQHPADQWAYLTRRDTKIIGAGSMLHFYFADRLHQRRGVSPLSSIISRMQDIRELEDAENAAAKVSGFLAAYYKRSTIDTYSPMSTGEDGTPQPREVKLQNGTIIDLDLGAGEDIGMIDPKRPNPNVEAHRNSQLRMIAAGAETSYSSVSKNYNGTWSAQRQELVEQQGAYKVMSADFIDDYVRPVIERVITMAIGSGALVVPKGIDRKTITDGLYVPPQMPWVDPVKEAQGHQMLLDSGLADAPSIIRARGQDPAKVRKSQQRWVESQPEESDASSQSE